MACQTLTIFPRIWEMMTMMGFYCVGCDMLGFMLLYDISESWLFDLFKLICNDIITGKS